MQRKLLVSSIAVAMLLLCATATAAPPAVFVRIEGAATTLLPQTLVQTASAATLRGHRCSAASAAGALDAATAGNWSGRWSVGAGFSDFFVRSIMAEQPAGNNFWTLWVNGRSASAGACATQLAPGDRELWFDCVADASFNCTNNPLALSAPSAVRLGQAASAHVVQLDGSGHSAPVGAAAVSGIGVAAVSGVGGRVRFVPHRTGLIGLQATKSGATPSDPLTVCVFRERASECRALGGAPAVHIFGIREHATLRAGPRELRGSAGPDQAGIIDVRLGLHRRAPDGRCSYYDADGGAWRALTCRAGAQLFSIGASARWSYLLPSALAAGRYRLEVLARDADGNTGSQAVDFTVARRAARSAAVPAPAVQIMVAGRRGLLLTPRSVRPSGARVRIGGRTCSVPSGTALAALLGAHVQVRVSDAAGCDPASMFLTRIGAEANRGLGGWEYKVGRADPSAGAADPAGRLRDGQQLLWYWCTRAGACERTLGVAVSLRVAGATVTVTGYDDGGHGRRVSGATVHFGSRSAVTDVHGLARFPLPPGTYTVYATKRGLIRSFPVTVGAVP